MENKSPLIQLFVKGIWETRRQISGKIPQRNKQYLFCCIRQHTSRTQLPILMHCSWRVTTEIELDSIPPYCMWKSY